MVAPVNTVLPALTGTIAVGATMTLGNGTWTGATSYAYAWLLDGALISGATSNTYVVLRTQIGSTLAGRVTATNVDGSTSADSVAQTVPGTLIVEDGTAKTDADSYISIADADSYHDKRGDTTWAALTPYAKEAALRKATDYLTGQYRARWKGYTKTATQSLTWPRAFVYKEPFYQGAVGAFPYLVPDNIVPVEVKNACASLALRASSTDILPDQGQIAQSVTVGPISTTYAPGSKPDTIYSDVEDFVNPYLNDANSLTATAKRA